MSLDISLVSFEGEKNKCCCSTCGNIHETEKHIEYFSANITHNLNNMADEAGIYKMLWRPEENEISCAKQLIDPLEGAIKMMKDDPRRFKRHDPENGWGSYDDFIPWLEELLEACKKYPEAKIESDR